MRRSDDRPPTTLHGHIEAQTAKALLFKAHHWEDAEWLPKSQAQIYRDEDTGEVEIKIAAWLADKNGWDEHGAIDPDPIDDKDEVPF